MSWEVVKRPAWQRAGFLPAHRSRAYSAAFTPGQPGCHNQPAVVIRPRLSDRRSMPQKQAPAHGTRFMPRLVGPCPVCRFGLLESSRLSSRSSKGNAARLQPFFAQPPPSERPTMSPKTNPPNLTGQSISAATRSEAQGSATPGRPFRTSPPASAAAPHTRNPRRAGLSRSPGSRWRRRGSGRSASRRRRPRPARSGWQTAPAAADYPGNTAGRAAASRR